jgi:hypothetical protein
MLQMIFLAQSYCKFGWAAHSTCDVRVYGQVYAVYNCNRKLLLLMSALVPMEIAGNITPSLRIDAISETFYQWLHKISLRLTAGQPMKGLAGCYSLDAQAFYFSTWITLLVFETIL